MDRNKQKLNKKMIKHTHTQKKTKTNKNKQKW